MPVPRPPTPRYLPDESAEEDEISQLSPLYDAYDRRTFIPFKKVKDAFLRMLGFGDRLDAVEAAVETKQNKLTAGDNITITEDVISATPPEQVQSDWDVDDTEDPAFIKNKPDIPALPIGMNDVSGLVDTLGEKLGNVGYQTIRSAFMVPATLDVEGAVNAKTVKAEENGASTGLSPHGITYQESSTSAPVVVPVPGLVQSIEELSTRKVDKVTGVTYDISTDGGLVDLLVEVATHLGITVTGYESPAEYFSTNVSGGEAEVTDLVDGGQDADRIVIPEHITI